MEGGPRGTWMRYRGHNILEALRVLQTIKAPPPPLHKIKPRWPPGTVGHPQEGRSSTGRRTAHGSGRKAHLDDPLSLQVMTFRSLSFFLFFLSFFYFFETG